MQILLEYDIWLLRSSVLCLFCIGASSDFEQATAVARSMVSRFGMSDKVGPVLHRLDSQSDVGPETRQLIEAEVKRFLQV